jgi:hypothetical protein
MTLMQQLFSTDALPSPLSSREVVTFLVRDSE